MKVTQKEIRLITDAIVDQVYDQAKVNEKINSELEKSWNEFKSSKAWKDMLKLLKAWKQIDSFVWIIVRDKDFFWIKSLTWSCDYRITTEAKAKDNYMNWKRIEIQKKFPDKYAISRKVETLLTIKTLCGKDMEKIINDIIVSIKKEFKL